MSNTYMDTIPNAAMCDSVITINLTVNQHSASTIDASICAGSMYLSPAGNMYDTTGVYIDTIPNMAGCDSVITINLNLVGTININLTTEACERYQFGGQMLTITGIYTDSLIASGGCDSVVTLDLTIHNPVVTNLTETACFSYDFGGQTLTLSLIHI